MICEKCGKEHDGSYGSGRFCCAKCARSFSTINKKKYKEVKCFKCGKHIQVNINTSSNNYLCDACKPKKLKSCPICGQINCDNEFCKKHNYQHFKSLIKYFGFDKSKFKTDKVEEEFNRVRNILYDLYWNKNMSSTEIAEKFNYKSIPTNITQKFFKKYLNIPVKTVKYSVKENYLEGRESPAFMYNQYKQQWYITWENKKVFLRSSYELDYAKELDNKKIKYDVEALHIKYWDSQSKEYKCAIPDFYLPDENMIVEIKSNYTLDKQNMIDRKNEYEKLGYKFKLICDHKEMNI